jgi:hypothetical protein
MHDRLLPYSPFFHIRLRLIPLLIAACCPAPLLSCISMNLISTNFDELMGRLYRPAHNCRDGSSEDKYR